MSYHSDQNHDYSRTRAAHASTNLFPDWDQANDSCVTDFAMHIDSNTPVISNYNDYSLPEYNNPNNSWPSLPPEKFFLPEDLADIQIQPLEARSFWHEGSRERSQFQAHCKDSLAVSPPTVERRSVDPNTLANYCNNGYCSSVPSTSSSHTFNSYCPTSPEDSRLHHETEDETPPPNDQGLGLTKDGRPRKLWPKVSLLPLSEEKKRAHEREGNRRSTAKSRTKNTQQRETLKQQLQQETLRKAALEQDFLNKTTELETLMNYVPVAQVDK